MNYLISNLKKDIRIALDQDMVSTQLLNVQDIDTLSLDDLIESKIADAVRYVEVNAPMHLLDEGTYFPSSSQVVTWDTQAGYGSGSVLLPDDFLRLVCFKMTDWDHPVYVPISEHDPLYLVQRSRFGGVRGNPQRPVCAIVNRSTGLNLEFYSCARDSNAAVAMASYIKIPKIEGTGASKIISICEKLKPSAVYYAAGLVAQAIKETALANDLFNSANNLMQ